MALQFVLGAICRSGNHTKNTDWSERFRFTGRRQILAVLDERQQPLMLLRIHEDRLTLMSACDRLLRLARRRGRELIEQQRVFTHDHDVAMRQLRSTNALAVHERTVRALQVLDHEIVCGTENVGVMTGDAGTVDGDQVVR